MCAVRCYPSHTVRDSHGRIVVVTHDEKFTTESYEKLATLSIKLQVAVYTVGVDSD